MQPTTYNNVQQPSLLRQIVDAADSMSEEQKQELLWNIKMQKAETSVKKADEILTQKPIEMTEEEAWEMVSKNRKQRYEQQAGN